jgi:hypothetical protein
LLPAGKAEKAAKTAVSGKAAAIFTLPGKDPGQAPAAMRIAAALHWRCATRLPATVKASVASAESTAWEFDLGMVLRVMFVLLLVTIVHVVATVPAAGSVDQVIGVVMNQPVYSLHDLACSSVIFFILGGAPACFGTTVSVLMAVGLLIAFDYFYWHSSRKGPRRPKRRLSAE